MINCKLCGKLFKPKMHTVKLCSDECKKASRYKSIRKYYERVVVPTLPGPREKLTEEHKKQKLKEFNNSPERKQYMRNYRQKDGVKSRERESGKRYKQRNPDVAKNGHLRRNFGISLEDYNKMLADQNNVCDICKNPESKVFKATGKITDLCVDHCHKTGKIRGLLCWDCNTSLGKMKESIKSLENAIDYLRKHNEKETL